MNSDKPFISIIIVNFNGIAFIGNCLRSIEKNCGITPFEIIVVDNASSDGSREYIEGNFPKVRLFVSGANIGFGRANNLGAEHARGKYLWFLNNDTIVYQDPLPALVAFVEHTLTRRPVGAVGLVLYGPETSATHSYGNFPGFLQQVRVWLGAREYYPAPGFSRTVEYATGASLFGLHETFRTVGGFDKDYFMYFEDADLQYRMRKLGLGRWLLNAGRVVHLEGGGKLPSNATRIASYNSLARFQSKHLGAVACRLYPVLHNIFLLIACLNPRFSFRENVLFLKNCWLW